MEYSDLFFLLSIKLLKILTYHAFYLYHNLYICRVACYCFTITSKGVLVKKYSMNSTFGLIFGRKT